MAQGILADPATVAPMTRQPRTFAQRQQRMIERQSAQQPGPGLFPMGRRGRQLINQSERQDVGLGQAAGGLMPEVKQAYSQPFDMGQLPQTPWSQGQSLKDLQSQYTDEAYNMFARTADPQFQRDKEAFDQEMISKGIPIDSAKYKELRGDLEDRQARQRQDVRTQALLGSNQYARDWNDISTSNFQNAYGVANAERSRPLAEFSNLRDAQSGLQGDYLNYAQTSGLSAQGAEQNRRALRLQDRLNNLPFRKGLRQELTRNEALAEQDRRLYPEKYRRESPYPGMAGNILGSLGGAFLGSERGSNWLADLIS